MRKIIVSFLVMFLLTITSSQIAFSQTTVIFKPNANIGKDANLFTKDYSNFADLNFGYEDVVKMNCWTWSGDFFIQRSLIKFEELSSIPTGAIITDVKLRLYGVNSTYADANSVYSGSSFNEYSNSVYVQRIASAWDESTVTWNTQPTTSTINQITIPESGSQYNWNYTIENSSELNTINSCLKIFRMHKFYLKKTKNLLPRNFFLYLYKI
jgi:hypothetical protein